MMSMVESEPRVVFGRFHRLAEEDGRYEDAQ